MEEAAAPEISHQWPQFLAVGTCLFLVVSTGVTSGWPSPAIPKLIVGDMQFNVSDVEASYIVMIYPLGYIVADSFGPSLVDSIGRKYSLLFLTIPQTLGWLLMALSTSVTTLYVGRLMSGISEGGAYIFIPMYICEISEPKVRGGLGMGYSTSLYVGFFLINCYGSFMHLRTSAYISIILPMLFLVTFMWMPESPYFLLMKHNREGARQALKKLRRTDNVESELVKLTTAVERQISESSTSMDLFRVKSTFKALLVLVGLRTFQQFSGNWSLIYYNQIIFEAIGSGRINPVKYSIIFYAAMVLVTCNGIILVDRFGRRPLLMCSTIGVSVCLFVQAICLYLKQSLDLFYMGLQWISLTAMIFYTVAQGLGLLAIPNLMAGELFPANIKARAIGMVNIYMALGISGVTKLFIWLDYNCGLYVPFFLFACCSTLGVFFIYYFVPETKGKSLEEIQLQLKGRRVTINSY